MCKACRLMAKRKGRLPSCEGCEHGMPKVHKWNEAFWWLSSRFYSAFWDGMGGLNAEALKMCMEASGVPRSMTSEMIQKLSIFSVALLK